MTSEVQLDLPLPPPTTRVLPMLIGLNSPAPASGKTEVARVLQEDYGFKVVRFAGPLKAMTSELLKAAGILNKEVRDRYIYGDLKEDPIPTLGGRSSRYIQQRLGTEFGRDLISPTLWVDLAMHYAHALRCSGYPVVIDDLRFVNEYDAIRAAGGKTMRIIRPGVTRPAEAHASEGALDGHPFDHVLHNDGPLSALEGKVMEALINLQS